MTGVVLCAAFGHENMIAHVGWRKLAEELASRGHHVLRFDYLGTGDSLGVEDDPCQLDSWKESIICATHHLIRVSGSKQIILIGLRLGGTLALLVSKDLPEVKGVGCLASPLVGRTYIRELRLRANGWREANLHATIQEKMAYLDVLGERLSDATIREISNIDLRVFKLLPKNIIMMTSKEEPTITAVAANLKLQECCVSIEDFPGCSEYLEDSIASVVPYKAFEKISDWCCQTFLLEGSVDQLFCKSAPPKIQLATTLSDGRTFLERAINFQSIENIFGILCTPHKSYDGGKVVIMLNTGFSRHIGDGRVFTMLARRLAQIGITSLRMDLAGFGDSELGKHEINPYAAKHSADIGAAITFLEKHGYFRPTLIGICSGAYNAFHASLHDSRIHGLILVNTQHFIWGPGSSLRVENKRQTRPLSFYSRAISRPHAWRRLMQGKVAVGSVLIALCKRPWIKLLNRFMVFLENLTSIETPNGQVRRWFIELAVRDVKIQLLYSSNDPGLEKFSSYFGKKGTLLPRLGQVRFNVMKDADHALFDHSARLKFVDVVIDFMKC